MSLSEAFVVGAVAWASLLLVAQQIAIFQERRDE